MIQHRKTDATSDKSIQREGLVPDMMVHQPKRPQSLNCMNADAVELNSIQLNFIYKAQHFTSDVVTRQLCRIRVRVPSEQDKGNKDEEKLPKLEEETSRGTKTQEGGPPGEKESLYGDH